MYRFKHVQYTSHFTLFSSLLTDSINVDKTVKFENEYGRFPDYV